MLNPQVQHAIATERPHSIHNGTQAFVQCHVPPIFWAQLSYIMKSRERIGAAAYLHQYPTLECETHAVDRRNMMQQHMKKIL